MIATSSKGLIDTGADIDYISKAFFNKINKSSDYKVENTDMILKSAFRNLQVYRPEGQIHNIKIQLHNQLTNKKEIIIVKDVLIIDSIYDIILSRKTIRANNLLRKCEDEILQQPGNTSATEIHVNSAYKQYDELLNKLMKTNVILSNLPKKRKKGYEQTRRSVQEEVLQAQSNLCTMCRSDHPREDRKDALRPQPANICNECLQPSKYSRRVNTLPGGAGAQGLSHHGSIGAMYKKQINSKQNEEIISLTDVKVGDILTKEQLWGTIPEEETFEIPEAFPNTFVVEDDEEEFKLVTVEGSEGLRKRIHDIIYEYKSIFSSKYHEEPANVTPYHFEIQEDLWYTSKNQERFRKQSPIKDEEIFIQVEVMIDNKVITSSDSSAWSQVMLTPKPNLKWRFAIDFRKLNDCMVKKGWPLPRIKEIIDQISTRHPRIFGKMDLTHGYHQIPISEEVQEYTTFITSKGLYKWKRLPMGIKNAGQYFQKILATEVFNGLSTEIVLPYVDDLHIAAKTEDEFIANLAEVCERLKKANIYVNPRKCFFGLSKIEILGHEISKEGTTFSREKLQGVNNVPLPSTNVQLMSFLGLGNYFRDNVKDYAKLEEPLRKLVKPNKHEKLIWLPNQIEAFEKMKEAIYNMPLLFFPNPNLPIYLTTDASDTGIGGYLYQLENQKEIPIGFYSQNLHNSELDWTTYEKEAFAIYKAVNQFQYLLTDADFIIKTDHRNLLYMNQNTSSDKVARWKMYLQQFNFTLEHIPGKDNIVADFASRLYTRMQNVNTVMVEHDNISKYLATLHTITDDENHDDIIKLYHNSTIGHHGIDRTLRLLRERAARTWPQMRTNVRDFIRKCPHCQFMADNKIKVHLQPYHVMTWRPMDRLNIDHIGPFPEDDQGNKYILVCIDVFSRFVELIPVPNREATTTARAVLQWIGRYGNPYELLSDNAPEYLSILMEELLTLCDVQHLTILPYSHEENSIVERANKEVTRHLKAIVYDKRLLQSWSLVLPIVQRIMNSMVNKTTQQTPASIIFGNSIDLDKNILYKHAPDKEPITTTQYMLKLLTMQSYAIDIAQKSQQIMMDKYDSQHEIPHGQDESLPLHSYVILEYAEGYIRKPNKLALNYRGPYKIINIDQDRYTLLNLLDDKTITTHRAHIRSFRTNEHVSPEEVAQNMAMEFTLESILEVKGKTDNQTHKRYMRTGLQFLIRWQGYDESYDSWEPYKEVKDTQVFKEYCLQNNLKYLIPNRYLTEED